MTLAPRILANRRNAKKSTGPRTEAGKRRVARNAIRHGLAAAVGMLPDASGEIAALANEIAGNAIDPVKRELARRVAEAQFEATRARQARHDLVRPPVHPNGPDGEGLRRDARGALSENDPNLQDRWLAAGIRLSKPNDLTAEHLLPETIVELADELRRIDRYERRALSRRKKAIRDFDAYEPAKSAP